jgi:REP-associated tyrosine transposase
MARLARLVVPHHPHHITQRGNRRLETFFGDHDYTHYIDLMAKYCAAAGTQVWGYCLMPNHVHFILVPSDDDGLRAALGEAHRRYTRHINFREGWRGHLWQERFHSFPMDENYLLACARYVELNPVRAGMVKRAEDWPWSSARAHLKGEDDGLVKVVPMLERMGDWKTFLEGGVDEDTIETIRGNNRTGRPLGKLAYVEKLERLLERNLKPGKRGPRTGRQKR